MEKDCDCLERMHLKVERELDRLRGDFKIREKDLLRKVQEKVERIEKMMQRESVKGSELK
jgi:hypothetical protein